MTIRTDFIQCILGDGDSTLHSVLSKAYLGRASLTRPVRENMSILGIIH